MAAPDTLSVYSPVYLIEIFLPTGTLCLATRETQIGEGEDDAAGYNIGGYDSGPYNEGPM